MLNRAHVARRLALFACLSVFSAGLAAGLRSEPAAKRQTESTLFGQTPAEFAARRAAVRNAAKEGIVLLRAPAEGDDVDRVRYRTENDIMYLTGVEAPGAVLALLPDGDPTGKKEILFLTPVRGAGVWVDAVAVPGKETERATGIEATMPLSGLWETLKPSIEKAATVYLPGPVGERARYTANGQMEDRVKSINPRIKVSTDATRTIHALRWQKSPGEIANLRAAIGATGDAQRAAARNIRPGVSELAVEGDIVAAFRKGGAPREGFPSIVGAGPNSTILHHFASSRKMQAGETVVVDIGAEYNYYSADITRTFPCGGKYTPRQRELYQLVLDCQKACEKYVVPGKTTLGELHGYAAQFLRKSPLRAKDPSGAERTMDTFFVHGLGHWLGMDVHDVGGPSSVLQPGVVFTIEPGVYVKSEGIGIRIEDDYLVTESGLEKLSKGIPVEVTEIEALMKGGR
jgi:Xaa-Pro aminopeptidase